MTTQHTPGPWEVMDSFYPSMKEVFGASFKIKCVMWATDLTEEDYQQRSADLRLIAAAPDLLAVLSEFKIASDNQDNTFDGSAWLDRVDAAIAKATGQV